MTDRSKRRRSRAAVGRTAAARAAAGRTAAAQAAVGRTAAARSPASWWIELQRSPLLTILSTGGILLGVLAIVGFLPLYFLLPATLLVAIVVTNEVRPILAERRLAVIGSVVPAIVTGLDPLKRIRKHPLESKWTLSYRYDADGAARRGRSRPLPWQVLDGVKAGDRIAVHVHPERPDVSAWIAGA